MDKDRLERERQRLITEEGATPLEGIGTYLKLVKRDGIHILEPREPGIYGTRHILKLDTREIAHSYV
jgi:hypothetical protein